MITWILLVSQLFLGVNEVVIRSPDGEIEVQEITGEESFNHIVTSLQAGFGVEEPPLIDFKQFPTLTVSREQSSVIRDYTIPLSVSEKEDISYIVNTLGLSSLARIAKLKSSLKKIGKKVDNVHPYNFLFCIFSDQKNRAALHAMKERSWVWDGFYDGLKGSLTEESAKGNLKTVFLFDFASKLGIDPSPLIPIVEEQDWNQLIKVLMKMLPRTGDAGRYDM